MKSTLFASTLAAALTATSFGQVEVELVGECCEGSWQYTYFSQILVFESSETYGYQQWEINVSQDTEVSFSLSMLGDYTPFIFDFAQTEPNVGPFAPLVTPWYEAGYPGPSSWNGSFVIPAGSYVVEFAEFEGFVNFGSAAVEAQGSCCVNSGCSSTGETTCTELGGTWTEGGSCDDCEPVADDCPADVDGDGSIGFSDVLIILNDWGACP